MNKKLFLGMFAVAGMLFATSCSNDELDVVQSGDEAQVTFSLAAEGGIATRAISDGKSANLLYYAIFDANKQLITTINGSTNGLLTKSNAFPNESKQDAVEVTLAKGQEYTAVFWAQDASCTAYTVTAETDGLKVAVDYDGDNNDETRDAFFKAETFKVTGNTEIDVVLKRPFAQINVGVTEADWNAAVESGINITTSKVVIKNAATSINLLDGTVEGTEEVTYDFTTIPAKFDPVETLEVDVNRDGEIQEEEKYKYLSMSYILTDNGADRTTLEADGLQFTFHPENGADIVFDEGLHAVPVQRNWRTNILGKILTGDIQFNIEIDQRFDDNYNLMYPDKDDNSTSVFNVTDVNELQNALNNATDGAVIYFANDITGDVTVTQKPNVKVSILGQGYKLNGTITVDGKSGTYTTAGLTIKEVNFAAQSITGDACIRLGDGTNATRYTCNITVDNCTFDVPGAVGVKSYTGGDKNLTITGCTATANAHSLVQAKGIDGILVEKCTVNSKNGLNFNNSTNVTVDECAVDVKGYAARFGESSGGAGDAEVYSIKNSSLKTDNSEGDAVIVLRGTADNSTLTIENTTIEGTEQINNTATNATVIIDGVATVSSTNALASVIEFGVTKIELSEGTYTIPVEAKNKTLTISGTENTKIDITSSLTYVNGADITFEGVTIQSAPDGAGYNKGFADMKYATFNDCVIDGTIGLDFSCEFNRCTFTIEGNFYNVWTWGAGEATFNECTFKCDGKALLVYANVLDNGTTHQTVNIKGCKFYDLDDTAVEGKAAIEITNTYTPIRTYDVFITNTEVYDFSQTVPGAGDFNAAYGSVEDGNIGTEVWGNKCKLSNEYLNVVIDNVDVY